MRVLLMGPPGAGKGTQADVVAGRLGVPHISTGEIFRTEAARGTPLGLQAKKYLDAGEYVPDEVTNAMVRARLAETDVADGFLLDGYPRTLHQVQALDRILADAGTAIDHVVELTVDTEEVVTRLLARAQESGRSDDTEAVIRHRLGVYFEQTAPLTDEYAARGFLAQVRGIGPIEDVTERVLAALGG